MPPNDADALSIIAAVCAAVLAQLAFDLPGAPRAARLCAGLSGACLGIGACFYVAARL